MVAPASVPGAVVAEEYGPVVLVPAGLERSLQEQGKSLSDSLGPTYYPKRPAGSADEEGEKEEKDNPIAPLQVRHCLFTPLFTL